MLAIYYPKLKRLSTFGAILTLVLLLIIGCEKPLLSPPKVIDDIAIGDEQNMTDWLAYGRTHSEQRCSPLTDVNKSNVANLKVDWFMDLPKDVGLVSTPLVVNGVLYFTGTMNIIKAVDAVNGKLLWEFDPKVAEHIKGKRQVGFVHNRGLTFYNNKIIAATWDGRLIAIDAVTGKQIWTTTTFDPNRALYITGTPKAFKGKVIIGNGGTEEGPTRGFVAAYDVETGKEAWKFYIVPGNPALGFENKAMEMAAKTWTGEWWKHGGGGNAWHAFTYDQELDVLYVGTGNGSPWNRKIRSPEGGDNLFLCAILALKPDTGEYLWHYQTTPGETWDYNSNMDIILADLEIEEKKVKAILHAPKNGFFYVLNRETGKLISAEPFVKTTWASHIDKKTGRPVEIEGARYENAPFDIFPSPIGAHTWHAMSYNPNTGLAYIPTINMGARFSDEGYDLKNWQAKEFIGGVGVDLLGIIPPEQPAATSYLNAWDPINQKLAWSVPQSGVWNAGTLTTEGDLVFQGRADGHLLAYDASTGAILWDYNVGLGISAPPITYKINGVQYISLLVGYGGSIAGLTPTASWNYGTHTRRLITFSLNGKTTLPELPPPYQAKPLAALDFNIDENYVAKGAAIYFSSSCATCHGRGAIAGGMAPDLRASPIPLSKEIFEAVVRDGAKIERAMPMFPDLSDDDLEALRHYIRKRARDSMPKKG